MAHVKAGSSNAHQKANVSGKRRGLKVNQGMVVRGGQVLVRQTGIVYKAGMNTKVSRDHSVVSRLEGVVSFSYIRRPNGVRTVVNVLPKVEKKAAKVAKEVVKPVVEKAEANAVAPKAEKVTKAPAKKVAAKKPATKKVAKKA